MSKPERDEFSDIGRPIAPFEPTQHLANKLMMSAKMEGFASFTRIEKIQEVKKQYGDIKIIEDEIWEISVKKISNT